MSSLCPVCARTFRDAHGRGGHLATYNDPEHDEYRRVHDLKHPLGPDGKPTVVGLRWRGPDPAPANPTPDPPAAPTTPDATPQPPPATAPCPLPAAAPPDTTNQPPEPTPEVREQAAPPPPMSGDAKVPGWLIGAGLGASALGLAALVKNLKGANKPTDAPAPTSSGRRPGMTIPDGIWAKPEPIIPTGDPYLDNLLGYSGLPKPRRRLTW